MHSSSFARLTLLLLSTTLSSTFFKGVTARPVEVLHVSSDGVMTTKTVDDSFLTIGRTDNSTGRWITDEFPSLDDDEELEFGLEETQAEDSEENPSFLRRLVARAIKKKPAKAPGKVKSSAQPPKKPGGSAAPKPAKKKPTPKQTSYILDCNIVPEICANICYFDKCKGGTLSITRKAVNGGRTVAAPCASRPNKCSVGFTGSGTSGPGLAFSGASVAGMQCDEYPLASSTTGGIANAATRCVPGGQNGSAGSKFNQVVPGVAVQTVLLNQAAAPFYCDGNCNRLDDVNGRQE